MRVVLDANVFVSAVISTAGPSRQILTAWGRRSFRADRQPHPDGGAARRLGPAQVPPLGQHRNGGRVHRRTRRDALVIDDPPALRGVSPDPDDDYLIALARARQADYLVSRDRHLLDLAHPIPPVLTPRQFLDLLAV